MKVLFTKAVGKHSDDIYVGEVHLTGAFDSTACGLANENYDKRPTKKPITCTTCLTVFEWAKKVSETVKK